MHVILGVIAALVMAVSANAFWSMAKTAKGKITATVFFLIGTAILGWLNEQWLIVLLVFSALVFIVEGIRQAIRRNKQLESRKKNISQ